jgi:hypothetical protein
MNPALRKPVGECTLTFPHQCRIHGGGMRGDWRGLAKPTDPVLP